MTTTYAIILAVAAILGIIVLISHYRLNPFIVLVTVSFLIAIAAGMPMDHVVSSFEKGAGHVLGHIATVIALGTILGKMLAESGGADRIALTISDRAGKNRVDWAMMIIGLLVGLPVFFEVGVVLLFPLAFVLSARTNTPILRLALPLAAALSVTHAMIPPHPATLLALDAYHANTGYTIFLGVIIGTPIAILAGPIFSKFAAKYVPITEENPLAEQFVKKEVPTNLPSFSITVITILSPVLLMLIGSAADLITTPKSKLNIALHFLGNTDIALLLATILSFYVLGLARGFSKETILKFANESLAPTALIMLLVGAGGGFGQELIDSGISKAITDAAVSAHIPLLILAWLLAALVRLACGSATVGMSTAASIAGPILAHSPHVSPELMVLVTGAGSVAFGPLNDAGFWQMKQYLGLTVPQTIKTWSAVETLIAVLGLVFVLIASLFV
ncbi:GntT/GntP/DsdX family permease [Swingsia samuiensis]|uniref:Permease DsdX n=1 Tax=Swingsia samuiensis TaxID=1293412 RepID=A0A4Y6UJH0_9PROT|nr:gluconate:H+ symporter [Swingsia samuiensis]QDH17769.1 permease DsdX [Swingsia samuiensis]